MSRVFFQIRVVSDRELLLSGVMRCCRPRNLEEKERRRRRRRRRTQ
mgnify:CR=1 FL=1